MTRRDSQAQAPYVGRTDDWPLGKPAHFTIQE